jgi:hypothetical protein
MLQRVSILQGHLPIVSIISHTLYTMLLHSGRKYYVCGEMRSISESIPVHSVPKPKLPTCRSQSEHPQRTPFAKALQQGNWPPGIAAMARRIHETLAIISPHLQPSSTALAVVMPQTANDSGQAYQKSVRSIISYLASAATERQ